MNNANKQKDHDSALGHTSIVPVEIYDAEYVEIKSTALSTENRLEVEELRWLRAMKARAEAVKASAARAAPGNSMQTMRLNVARHILGEVGF